jgi:hypothetical protein
MKAKLFLTFFIIRNGISLAVGEWGDRQRLGFV